MKDLYDLIRDNNEELGEKAKAGFKKQFDTSWLDTDLVKPLELIDRSLPAPAPLGPQYFPMSSEPGLR
jgi:hypothetical protein